MNKPYVSFIMSSFNNEKTISNSISTYSIMQQYAKKTENIKVFQNRENIGLTKSLNLLLDQSNSPLIARQDADDTSHPNRLKKQINFLESNNLDACTTLAMRLDNNKKIPGFSKNIPLKVMVQYKNPFIHGTLLIKKDVISDLNNYDELFYLAQDYKLMSDLIKNNYKVKILKEVLYKLNMKNNLSSLKKEDQKYFAECVKKGIQPNEHK
jgi:glycosyltransferase involved in cell wall biosynthesis